MKRWTMLMPLFFIFACTEREGTRNLQRGLSEGRVWQRLYTVAPGKLRYLLEREGFDVTGSSHRYGFVDVLTSPEKADQISQTYAARVTGSERLALPKVDPLYTDPAEMSAFLDSVQANHPGIASKITLDDTLFEGHALYAMKISDNVATDEDEPTYMMTCNIHAREVMTGEVCRDAIEYLTSNYGTNQQVTRWVDELEIWIVPQLNPDGVAYVFASDDWWRTNRHPGCPVDCNRNFSFSYRHCDGSSDYCGDETYHGTGPASEPETQAAEALMAALRPMYYIDYHSYGEYILWPGSCQVAPDDDELLGLTGWLLHNTVQTDDGQTGQWTTGNSAEVLYQAPGTTDDQAWGANGAMAYTIELNSWGFQPAYNQWRDVTCQRQRVAWGTMLERTLDAPQVRGHTFDAQTLAPVVANWQFASHPFTSGQWPLRADAAGRFGRAVLPNSDHTLVFTAAGYLPEVRQVHVAAGPVDLEVPMIQGTNHAPTVSAGPDFTVDEGSMATLQASGSDPEGNQLFYRWTQTGGPQVTLQNATTAQPSFFAPGVAADTVVSFQVVASDGELESPPDTVQVTVRNVWDGSVEFPSTDTPINIPDYNSMGIYSVIHVSEERVVLSASATVDITHTWIGDLYITVTSPAGTQVVLHNHEGGSDDYLHATYHLPQVVGEASEGDWVLFVRDDGPSDVGTLNYWRLTLELGAGTGCQNDADCQLPHVADADCVSGQCVIVACESGFSDCDGQAGDGCETNINTDPANCGGCGLACSNAHGTTQCQAATCQPTCTGLWGDCDGHPANGCETALNTLSDCGACAVSCQLNNASESCSTGSCQIVACDSGFADCNVQATDGCETQLGTVSNCGGCGITCTNAHGTTQCQGDTCVPSCASGFGDCDANADNGCESSLASVDNCGACGTTCANAHGTTQCQAGTCVPSCASGFGDCDANANNGCEASLNSVSNCGACGASCTNPHGTTQCPSGVCVPTCAADYGDCDADPRNGCEASLNTVDHCGGCTVACTNEHGTVTCVTGYCVPNCAQGFGDCDANPANGCETSLATPANCGACGAVCNLPHAQAVCLNGACQVASCQGLWADCNGQATDGCEVDASGDTANCGGCGAACSNEHGSTACVSGACVPTCDAGFGDCDANAANGCETALDTTSDCGACGAGCTNEHGTTACVSGACVPTCAVGYGDCDGSVANGCEAELNTNTHCGGCGQVCDLANASESCASGSCRLVSCSEGFGNCNGQDGDGCETDTSNDEGHCGECGHACPADQTCIQGECRLPCTDADGDGHAAAGCGGDDCDDADGNVHPGASEICNGRDDDCNGRQDEGLECGSGCGCAAVGRPGSSLLWLLLVFIPLRRRQA